jgi:hypothetical protein
MTPEVSTQKMMKLKRNTAIEKLTKSCFVFVIFTVLLVTGTNISAQDGTDSPQNKNSGNNADQSLKSIARINPSTLAMEFSLPMMSYPGRNGNAVPVQINYSSKIWRMRNYINYFYTTPGGYRQYVTQLSPEYAERTAAGWSSSLGFPVIQEKLELYDQNGNAFTFGGDFSWANSTFEGVFTENRQSSGGEGQCSECNYNYGYCDSSCSSCSGYCYNWCQYTGNQGYGCPGYGGGGGGGGSPTPTPSGSPSPSPSPTATPMASPTPFPTPFPTPEPIEPQDRMHYVKRINVRMGDGSVHEFRKSDEVFGYCAGGANDGPNCETLNPNLYGNFLSVDGTGMRLEKTTDGSTLYLPDGSRYFFSSDITTGGGDDGTLYPATEYVDTDGNKTEFRATTVSGQTIRQTRDTLGREINDFLPKNYNGQEQNVGLQQVNLPGLNGSPQTYNLKWLHLKPVPCTEEITTNCGETEGALENQAERLYHYTAITCMGSAMALVDSNGGNPANNNYPNEIMFPANGLGLRSCNPYSGNSPSNLVARRFNPIVLAEIQLPNGKKYEFKYNQFGEISKIIYPTGSYETFQYGYIPPVNGLNHFAYDQTNRGVIERKVYRKTAAGGYEMEQRWRYSADILPLPNAAYKITTIAPKADNAMGDGVKTERFLYTDTISEKLFGFGRILPGMPYEERVYAENDYVTPRSRTLTEYTIKSATAGNTNSVATIAQRDARVKRTVSVMIENGKALATLSETEYNEPNVAGNNAQTDAEYFSHLNVKRTKSYHYAAIPLSVAKNDGGSRRKRI